MTTSGHSRSGYSLQSIGSSSQQPIHSSSSSPTYGQGFVRFVLKMVARHNPDSSLQPDSNLSNRDNIQAFNSFRQKQGLQASVMSTPTLVGGTTNSSTKRKPSHGADNWSYLWAPLPLSLTLVYHQTPRYIDLATPQISSWNPIEREASSFTQRANSTLGNQTAETTEARPFLLIQSGQEILERFHLDVTSVKTSRLKGIMKESIIGFRYNHLSPESLSPEERKLQIKFVSPTECGQCASMLLPYMCIKVVGVSQGQQNNLDSVGAVGNFSSSSVPRTDEPLASQTSEVEISSQTQVLSTSQPQFFNSQELGAPVGSGSGGCRGGNESTTDNQLLPSPFVIAPRPIPVHSTVAPSTSASAPSSVVQVTFGLQTTDGIERLLNKSNKDFQDEVNRILVDPKFPDLLVKVEQALRGIAPS